MISPYFIDFTHKQEKHSTAVVGIPTGTSLFGDKPSTVNQVRSDSALRSPVIKDNSDVDVTTGETVGSYGIKQDYLQETPAAQFPPINYKSYAKLLVFDEAIKKLIYDREFKFRPDVAPPSSHSRPTSKREHEKDEKPLEPQVALSLVQTNNFKKNVTEP